jgi:hypothetical protein
MLITKINVILYKGQISGNNQCNSQKQLPDRSNTEILASDLLYDRMKI